MNTAEIRALFPGLTDQIYLNTATMCAGNAPAREAYERAVAQWSAGRCNWMKPIARAKPRARCSPR